MQQACAHAEAQPASSGSWLYMLERFHIGLVHIDRRLRVVGMNDYAPRCLPVEEKLPFGKLVTAFHPKASRAKVQVLRLCAADRR
jgi:LytTR family transcriptional regulator, CO-responsive transcriptional regulator RcoM